MSERAKRIVLSALSVYSSENCGKKPRISEIKQDVCASTTGAESNIAECLMENESLNHNTNDVTNQRENSCVDYTETMTNMKNDHKENGKEEKQYQYNDSLASEFPKVVVEMINSHGPGTSRQTQFRYIEEKDSDDSIKDKDFVPDSNSDASSSDSESENQTARQPEENTTDINRIQMLNEERENWKGRPKKGRHRKYPGQTCRERKKLKDSNLTHYTTKGKIKESKEFIDYKCNCDKQCSEMLRGENRKILFEKFWNLASYDLQTSFIGSSIKEVPVKRKRAKNRQGKTFTRTYMLGDITVCRNMFIHTYQISTKRVNTAVCKVRNRQLEDRRGRAGGKKEIGQEVTEKIIHHISRFPTYTSHYARAETSSKFLPHDLTESKMFELYTLEDENPKVSFTYFKSVFYKNFNLRRKAPIKDTCNKCDLFTAQIKNSQDETEIQGLKDAHTSHLEKAEIARNQMKRDVKEAIDNPLVETLTYDMQKVLSLPKLPTNLVYYKRQLNIYNEGIHSGKTDTPYCFIWKEGVAGRGAQEVGSCLKKFVNLNYLDRVENLILWSDSCGGQNRNIKIILILKNILMNHPTLKTISLKFLESGHSYLPNDTDFGQIERALKKQVRIYTLDDFTLVIANCKNNKKFLSCVMQTQDFYSTADLEKQICNRKITTEKEKISWLKSRVIKIEKDKPFSIFFKETHDREGTFKEVDISKNTGRGRKPLKDFLNLGILYPTGKPISKQKWDDIKSLMKFIPTDARNFYKISNTDDFEDDVDGFGPNTDFQIEADD